MQDVGMTDRQASKQVGKQAGSRQQRAEGKSGYQ